MPADLWVGWIIMTAIIRTAANPPFCDCELMATLHLPR